MKYVYILRSGEKHYKVGISSNVLSRLKSIQTSNQNKIIVVASKLIDDASKVENDLHIWLAEFKADGGREWFALEPEQALELVIKVNNLEMDNSIVEYLTLRELQARMIKIEKKVEQWEKDYEVKRMEIRAANLSWVKPPKDTEETYFDEARELVAKKHQHASASFLQRRLRIGYVRAARLIDQLEKEGIVGSSDGARPREILVSK